MHRSSRARRAVAFCSALAITSVTVLFAATGPSAAQPGVFCTRAQLHWAAAGYLNILTQHWDPQDVPLASNVKLTENGELTEPGEGFWQTAGRTRAFYAGLDTQTCQTHTMAVMEENGEDVIVGVRLRFEGNMDEVSEIETYVTREDDYFFYNPPAFVTATNDTPGEVGWMEPVPEDQRSTREELTAIADSYYESFGSGGVVAPMDEECYRWENGELTGDGDCASGLGFGSPDLWTDRRYPFADVESGIVVGYVMFGGALDFHMFKVVDGQIRLINALVTAGGHDSSGWD